MTTDEPDEGPGRAKAHHRLLLDARFWFPLFVSALALFWFWPETPVEEEIAGLGTRLIPIGEVAPKGGGHFKIGQPYTINGVRFVPQEEADYNRTGVASWYGALFHGRKTSNGEIFDMERLSAAHPTLPLPAYVEVTNLSNGLSAIVRVNDRGPFRKGRLIDLSDRAAEVLGFKKAGTAEVRVRYLKKAPLDGDDSIERAFLSKKGFSEYAGTVDVDGMAEVAIAVGPPGPPPPPPLPDRPERATEKVAAPDSQPVMFRARALASVEREADPSNGLAEAQALLGSAETTGSITPSAATAGGPLIQAGFFKDRGNAERAEGALSGIGPVRVEEVIDRGETYYRVRVGPFADGIAAAAALSSVADAGYGGAKIVLNN